MNIEFKKAIYNLDKILAILGLALALTLILTSLIIDNPMYAVVGIILLFACIAYLSVGRGKGFLGISELPRTPSLYLLLNILFFSALLFSILSLYLRPDPYVRPLSYFVSIVVMVGILAVEILFLPRSKPCTYFVLTKIILIPLSLVWSQLLIFPTLIGDDPWWHQRFTQSILDSGFISGSSGYSRMPVMHLMIGATSLVTGLGYKMAALISISSMQIISLLLFVFLLGRFVFDAKVGLLATLLLGISSYVISFSYRTIPMTLGAVLIPIIIYLLFKVKQSKPLVAISLSLLLMVTLILIHPLATTCMAILLFALWGGFEVFNRIYNKRNTAVTLNIATLFVVAMFGWWMYASGHIRTLSELIKWAFSFDYWVRFAPVYEAIAQYTHRVPFSESLFNSIGLYLFLVISLPGCFYMLSKRASNPYAFSIAAGAMAIVGLIFVVSVFHFGILSGRWHYFIQILSSVPLAVTLLLFSARIKNEVGKILFVTTLITALTFLMIMTPTANMDNPLFKNTTIRRAYTESELQATETILDLTDQNIATDGGIVGHFVFLPQFPSDRIFLIAESFYTKDFTEYRDSIIMIRREISQGTITITGDSFIRLGYDPAQFLADEGFSRIYESASVSAFYWNSNQTPSQRGP